MNIPKIDGLALWHKARATATATAVSDKSSINRKMADGTEKRARTFLSAHNITLKAITAAGTKQMQEMAVKSPESYAVFMANREKDGIPVWVHIDDVIHAHMGIITRKTIYNHINKLIEFEAINSKKLHRDTFEVIVNTDGTLTHRVKYWRTKIRVFVPAEMVLLPEFVTSTVQQATDSAGKSFFQKSTDNQLVTSSLLQQLPPFINNFNNTLKLLLKGKGVEALKLMRCINPMAAPSEGFNGIADSGINAENKENTAIDEVSGINAENKENLSGILSISGVNAENKNKFGGLWASASTEPTSEKEATEQENSAAAPAENVHNSEVINIFKEKPVSNVDLAPKTSTPPVQEPVQQPQAAPKMTALLAEIVAARVSDHLPQVRMMSVMDYYANALVAQCEMLFNGGEQLPIQCRINAHTTIAEYWLGGPLTHHTLIKQRAADLARAFANIAEYHEKKGTKAYHINAILSTKKCYEHTDSKTKATSAVAYLEKQLIWLGAADARLRAQSLKCLLGRETFAYQCEINRAIAKVQKIYTDMNFNTPIKMERIGKIHAEIVNLATKYPNMQAETKSAMQANFIKTINFHKTFGF
jgi:hypothetical protein